MRRTDAEGGQGVGSSRPSRSLGRRPIGNRLISELVVPLYAAVSRLAPNEAFVGCFFSITDDAVCDDNAYSQKTGGN